MNSDDQVELERKDEGDGAPVIMSSSDMDRFALHCVGQAIEHMRHQKVPRPYILTALKVYTHLITQSYTDEFEKLATPKPSDQEQGG